MRAEISLSNIRHYLVGNILYYLYYSRLRCIVPKHIREQYEYRLRVMDRECYANGTCKHCGCVTTKLQFASKQCGGRCYPPMMSRRDWEDISDKEVIYYKGKRFKILKSDE